MRHEYCEKNGVLITYSDDDVAFEETDTAMAILIANNGDIIHNNFQDDATKTNYFLEEFKRIYPIVSYFRTLDNLEDVV
ncbi:MAG: hypothetical protein IJ675_00985 [Pseudobutyrivibrio sp.]|nr:hypothetical protein [Pseudobutyrivibrio sp.]